MGSVMALRSVSSDGSRLCTFTASMTSAAICPLAAVPLRKEPSDTSEMTSQILLGETMEVLEPGEKWSMVKLHHDGYEGWVSTRQIQPLREPAPAPRIFRDAALQLTPGIIPAGALLRDAEHQMENTPVPIAQYASMFLGAPYLWGGRTILGMDCSGFTQLVFRLTGKEILRDAWQQATLGEEIAFVHEALNGDLAFFDNPEGRIIHVGLVLREEEQELPTIIHASGKVRVDILDHEGIFNRDIQQYSHRLRTIRRLPFS